MIVRSVGVGRVWDCMMCTYVSEEGGDREGVDSEAPSLLSYTLRYVSLAELVNVFQVGLREPMHLCPFVNEEGGDGNLYMRYYSLVVYYESMKRELKTRPIYECRYDERLKTKGEESTRLTYTGFLGELSAELEHLNIVIRKAAALTRVLPKILCIDL
jgi:hypothetical protein